MSSPPATLHHPVDLEPSLLEDVGTVGSTYTTRGRRHLLDGAALLSLLVMLNLLLPQDLVVQQLSSLGRPALLLGMVFFFGWLVSKLHPRLALRGPQPVRWAAIFYLAAVLSAYAAGYLRGLPSLEANAADRAIIGTAAFLGVLLVCADGVSNRDRLDSLLKISVWCGMVMAAIGLLQAGLAVDVTKYIKVPGLVLHHGEELGFMSRGDGFFRVASTAQHYIEFSTVMAILLPFAVHYAMFGIRKVVRQWAVVAGVLMGAAIPMTLSRTGIVALVVGALAMLPAWSWRVRINLAGLGVLLGGALMAVKPGLIGTIVSMFTGAPDDPSITGRTDDYAIIFQYFAERPFFGRGPGTFIPTIYFFVDNEWLQHLVTMGVLGVAGLAGLHLTALTLGVLAYRRATRPEDRHLAACLIAVQLIAVTVAATFDSLGFTTYSTMLALMTGATGAVWRLTHPARMVRSSAPRLTND
ncbi:MULTISPECIES: O-antigen ligase family protein [Catenuloplanes]|uniref:O-antigen ligase n=1 Tax=Catenuloplanes niger TaxID=587534 RepID=A0AAE3ZS02_9ACTN|nr:O-antigen ligase family protein [Catenuloplanes niger]MDR7324706.1 O-antigen ligase [Catenuloplanes niger]